MRTLALTAALALSACGQANAPRTDSQPDTPPAVEGNLALATRYLCPDGSSIEATYPSADSAVLNYTGETLNLRLAESASGSRYVGDGWEWWTKGQTEGTLSPLQPGEEIATEPGVICTVQ